MMQSPNVGPGGKDFGLRGKNDLVRQAANDFDMDYETALRLFRGSMDAAEFYANLEEYIKQRKHL